MIATLRDSQESSFVSPASWLSVFCPLIRVPTSIAFAVIPIPVHGFSSLWEDQNIGDVMVDECRQYAESDRTNEVYFD